MGPRHTRTASADAASAAKQLPPRCGNGPLGPATWTHSSTARSAPTTTTGVDVRPAVPRNRRTTPRAHQGQRTRRCPDERAPLAAWPPVRPPGHAPTVDLAAHLRGVSDGGELDDREAVGTMTQLVFIDTETSGLDPERHEVWEIGCIVRGSTDESSNGEWLWQLKPDLAAADPTGLRVGRYYEREQLWRWGSSAIILASPWWNAEKRSVRYPAEATSRSEVAERLAKLLGGAHLVGAVPSFDAAFLT